MKDNKLNYNGQKIFVGIDVHKKQWSITIIAQGTQALKERVIDPKPKVLYRYLTRRFPGGDYYSVYEAGFSGYWAHRELLALGINNIIVNPADIPTRSKERRRKTDRIDSWKLARELSVGNLEGIYIPTKSAEALRNLVRLRERFKIDQARTKNRIKSLLNYLGIKLPSDIGQRHWSKRFITALSQLEMEEWENKQTLNELLRSLESTRKQIKDIVKSLRERVYTDKQSREIMELLMSVPGVGFITAIAIYSEIMDMKRFKKFDELAAYVGLAPAVYSSGEKQKILGLSKQRNKYLRNLLIESAWTALRKDDVLLNYYGKLRNRMSAQRAIIIVSKKLLSRIRAVWLKKEKYVAMTIN